MATELGVHPQALFKGTIMGVQELNQPGRMSLLTQTPGQLENAVSRPKPTQESGPGH